VLGGGVDPATLWPLFVLLLLLLYYVLIYGLYITSTRERTHSDLTLELPPKRCPVRSSDSTSSFL